MALFNRTKREINAKIVYFGPPLAGKATTLQFIHRKLKPECRGPIKTMGGRMDRMLFFDFMPPELGEVNDYRVRFHLYTVQGEITNPSTWKTVLKGTDGIVFVADASPESAVETRESFESLRGCLRNYGQGLETLPCVIQSNKSDLPDALDTAEVVRVLDASVFPVVKSAARSGEGVLQALSMVVKGIMNALRDQEAVAIAAPVPSANLTEVKMDDGFEPQEREDEKVVAPLEAAECANEPRETAVPTLVMGGAVTVSPEGILRVPLTVRCGGVEKGFVFSLTLTPDIAPAA